MTVLVPTQIAAMNIDSLNSDAICTTADLANGSVVVRGALSTVAGQSELFTVSAPASTLTDLWMVYSPEVVVLKSGSNIFKGLSADPRDFTNIQNYPLNIFKPRVGDLITVTAEAFASELGTNTFANATTGEFKLTPAAAEGTGLSFKVLNANKFISIGNERVPAVLLECTKN